MARKSANAGSGTKVRLTLKMTNAILAELSDRFGSYKAAAAEIGVSAGTFSTWLRFKATPKFMPGSGGGGMSRERTIKVITNLERLTGRNITEIFPKLSKAELGWLSATHITEKPVDVRRLSHNDNPRQQIEYNREVSAVAEYHELQESINDAIDKLEHREQHILRGLYGLGREPVNLKELGGELSISKERVRQIGARALANLKQSPIRGKLKRLIDRA